MTTTKHRLILPIQAKGNVGKSIEAAARACWLNERGIHWQGFDLAKDHSIGITVMVFPLDDLDVMMNIDVVCRFCGNEVDYVIVRNPARAPKTRMFDVSELEKELLSLQAGSVTLPVLSEFAKL